ncbi:hypothetical protein I6I57_13700 [Brevibacterium casei]|uniref:Uncharacterized protein n=1 Tax=Brevibacterium ammoniilyticum TaxID=1046555 RepID=A0ABP9U697_9MICO|nr:hypothetical protein [Brevibacterium casei]QQT68748.1 hypothetical protein I6I57_13700 [Brevibacterium casei]
MLPRSEDPAEASEAFSEAVGDLSLASRWFKEPGESYQVLGNLQIGMIDLHQVLTQVAGFHHRTRDRAASDDGDRALGAEHADAASAHLEHAARLLDQATDELMAGFSHSGHIAWQQAPAQAVLDQRQHDLDVETSPVETRKPSPPSW